MIRVFKPEWGNKNHIKIVRQYDARMSAKMPVDVRIDIGFARVTGINTRCASPLFSRTHVKTTIIHAVIICPDCTQMIDVAFDSNHNYTLDECGCGCVFELREDKMIYVKLEDEA